MSKYKSSDAAAAWGSRPAHRLFRMPSASPGRASAGGAGGQGQGGAGQGGGWWDVAVTDSRAVNTPPPGADDLAATDGYRRAGGQVQQGAWRAAGGEAGWQGESKVRAAGGRALTHAPGKVAAPSQQLVEHRHRAGAEHHPVPEAVLQTRAGAAAAVGGGGVLRGNGALERGGSPAKFASAPAA